MESRDLLLGIMLLSVCTFGILGNFSLLSYYLVLNYKELTLTATGFILTHLTIANSLVILCKAVPQTLAAFGLKHLFNDWRCRLFLYIHRLGRNVSIGSTCFLSIFQAITISPRNSRWSVCKVGVSKYIRLSISLCWILYMVVNFIFPVYLINKGNIKNMTKKRDFEYCSIVGTDVTMESVYVVLLVFPEVLFYVLILWSSGSMVVILHRHQQRVQHIRSPDVPSRASPETRATRRILALVSSFVIFYTLSSILNACVALLNSPSRCLMNINSIISICFPAFGPFVLMSHDSTVSRLCFVWMRNQNKLNI